MEAILNRTAPLIRPSRGLQFLARSVAASPVLANLLRFYKYDDGSGDVLTDYSGLGNHGQLGSTAGVDTNDPAWVAQGLSFDGVDNYVIIPDFAPASEFTIQIVSLFDSALGGKALFGHATQNNKAVVNLDTNYQIRATSGGAFDVGLASPAVDTWAVFTLRRDGANKVDAFINDGAANRLFGDVAQPGNATLNRLGASSLGQPFNGTQSHALFYDAALSDAEIQGQNYDYLQSELAGRGITLP